jgi:hypothetical protein
LRVALAWLDDKVYRGTPAMWVNLVHRATVVVRECVAHQAVTGCLGLVIIVIIRV